MSRKSPWSRGDKWTAAGVIIAVVAIIVGLFLPEVRTKIGLEKSAKPVSPAAPKVEQVQSKGSIPSSPPVVQNSQVVQHSKAEVLGHDNAVGNQVTGEKNIVGSNNRVHTTAAPTIQVNNAPNGIAIGGGIVNNPTVYNFGPPPSPTPTITICVSQPEPPSEQQTAVFQLNTDVKIVEPWYAFFFDGPVLEGSVSMDGHGFGYTHGRAEKLPNPERSFWFRLTSIDFGTNTWSPQQVIKITVPSDNPVHLVRILSGSEENGLNENILFHCG